MTALSSEVFVFPWLVSNLGEERTDHLSACEFEIVMLKSSGVPASTVQVKWLLEPSTQEGGQLQPWTAGSGFCCHISGNLRQCLETQLLSSRVELSMCVCVCV